MTRLDIVKDKLFEKLGHTLYIKRDDLYPLSGGGNKGRKLDYIINQQAKNTYNALVTTGSNQSNHIRASLIRAKELGWKTHIVIHDKKPKGALTGNLRITKLLADKISYVDMKDVASSMDNAMFDLKKDGYEPLYIWGGGHCLEGTYAYHDAILELKKQLNTIEPDYIFLASGTGATQAGLVSGAKSYFKNCKVIGISIAREKERGKSEVFKSVQELESYLGTENCFYDDVYFDDAYNGGGYNMDYNELNEVINNQAQNGIILDKTYTAKAFYGMIDYVKKGKIKPNSKIVFWHTGGLLNFLS
jgi:1-aminocyclopropane-1-carboxylate deaminase/D-cysteine desulfhydrase-like pyridoxal-dependent ACC family enzyme